MLFYVIQNSNLLQNNTIHLKWWNNEYNQSKSKQMKWTIKGRKWKWININKSENENEKMKMRCMIMSKQTFVKIVYFAYSGIWK